MIEYIQSTKRYGVGVSGGRDSLTLLHLLHEEVGKAGLDPSALLLVIHCNHQLRVDSKANKEYVEGVARRLSIPFRAYTWDSPKKGEGKAREWRLECFNSAVNEYGLGGIYLGHTSTDDVETILHKIVRGTSPRGLGGLNPISRVGNLTLIRPLLEWTRTDTLNYCNKRGIYIWEDSSNEDLSIVRNRLRLGLIPSLRVINPRVEKHISQLSAMVKEDDDYLTTLALEQYGDHLRGSRLLIPMGDNHPSITRRLVFRWLELNMGRFPTYGEVEEVLLVMGHEKVVSNHLRGGYQVKGASHHIDLEKIR